MGTPYSIRGGLSTILYDMAAMTFGRWLADELDRRDMTQADFARKVGASTGRVSEWLSGKRRPSPESLDRISDALPGVNLDYLLSIAGHRPIDPGDPPIVDPLAALVATFTPRQREMLLSLLDQANARALEDEAVARAPKRQRETP
jgi:transcriptional regulator with XRE-family HTH domain